MTRLAAPTLCAIALMAGCASAPRSFDPVLRTAPADEAAFAEAREACRTIAWSEDRTPNHDAVAAGGIGAAAGVGVMGAAAPGVIMGEASLGAASAAAVVAVPVFAYAASRQQRAAEERRINDRFALCLAERGYEVADWTLAEKEGD